MRLIKDSICCQVKKQNNTNENDSDNISDVNIDTSKVESKNLTLNISQLLLFFNNCLEFLKSFEYGNRGEEKKYYYRRYGIKSLGNPSYYNLVNNGVDIGVGCLEIHGVLCDEDFNNVDLANFWVRIREDAIFEGKLVAHKYNAQNSDAMEIFEKAIENVTSAKISDSDIKKYKQKMIQFLSIKPQSGKNFYNLIKQNGLNRIVYCKIGDDFKKLDKICKDNVNNICLNNFLTDKTSSTEGIIVSEYNGIMGDGWDDLEEAQKYVDYFCEYNDCIVFSFLKRNKNILFEFNPKKERLYGLHKKL